MSNIVDREHDYMALNAMLNIYGEDGSIQFDKDHEAVRQFFLQHVNQNTVFFHSLEEKLSYLLDNDYYEKGWLDKYSPEFVKDAYKASYAYEFRFQTFVGAYKFYTSYTLKNFEGDRYLERFEDRITTVALVLADGDETLALRYIDEMMTGRFQPATPTFLNLGKAQRGEPVSCFPAGTPVETITGRKPIEEITTDDQVLTHDGTFQQVQGVMERVETDALVTLHLVDNENLILTPEHPVLTYIAAVVTIPDIPTVKELTGLDGALNGFSWVAAKDIQGGMFVAVASSNNAFGIRLVEKVSSEAVSSVPVYNLEVENNHTYVASGVVVHNCFLVRTEDNMESIIRTIGASLQLSKRGGGVALLLSNLRESGAPIKKIKGQSSGVIPVMKLLEDSFSYANQLGARQGAGAVYLHAHHPDIMNFLDTKRENADEKIRIKTLSLGVIIPDITFELARNNEDMYLFSPYDVERFYGKAFSDISITEHYHEMVDNPKISKKKISARTFFMTIAEIQIQSGYPYILFEDTANKANPIAGRINMSNLCSEILQVNSPSTYNEDTSYSEVGMDISCNLGSLNIAKTMDGGNLESTVETAIRALTAVSEMANTSSVPSIERGNNSSHAIGLGQMNLHGFFGRERIMYGSEQSVEFTSVYFAAINFYAIKASNKIAIERGETFVGFKDSTYASGAYFEKYVTKDWKPTSPEVKALFKKFKIAIPSRADWAALAESVKEHGIFNRNLQAVPPTGSISYINDSTSSIHPIAARIEIRKEGKIGRVYYPAFGMNADNLDFYQDAYTIGYKQLIDVYAAATEHVDQGLSCTLFFQEGATTRDINKAQTYAWRKGLKTIYYVRMRQTSLSGTEIEGCVSCTL